MTNREWLRKLSDGRLAKDIASACVYCIHNLKGGGCSGGNCAGGILEWLRAEHEEAKSERSFEDYSVKEEETNL